MQKKTVLEKVTGNLPTESALTLVAAASGMPVAALLPVLSNILAEGRYKKRVQACIEEINEILLQHEQQLKGLSDGQYKLINETVLAILQTTNPNKLKYLKNAIKNTLLTNKELINDGVFLSRAIRDISADEASFLIKNFSYEYIRIGSITSELDDGALAVLSNSHDELICAGLISLGLIVTSGATIDDLGLHKFSNLVAKLIVLIQD